MERCDSGNSSSYLYQRVQRRHLAQDACRLLLKPFLGPVQSDNKARSVPLLAAGTQQTCDLNAPQITSLGITMQMQVSSDAQVAATSRGTPAVGY